MKKEKFFIIQMLALSSLPAFAEEAGQKTAQASTLTAEELLMIVFGIIAAGVALIALLFCIYFLYVLNGALNPSASVPKPAFSLVTWLNEKFGLGKLKPIEDEGEIALEHNYDGIVELDNGMPPWLKYLFSGTIVFAVIYLANYLVFDSGLNQTQEYEQELAIAGQEAEARKLLAVNSLDETSVTVLQEKALIEEGKTLFEQNCRACHGAIGEGGVGPNLTDAYWLHGGKINDIFKSIKYGIPEKGMISWQAKLKPAEIQKVASYILTLQGTNPPNGKEPQGDLLEGSVSVSTKGAKEGDIALGGGK
jgi:cytochrome c oxidase cbb3-type subunit III